MQRLARRFFRALSLPFRDYGNRDAEPELAPVKRKYEEALQDYLFFFRALADLRRSWRIVLPNLEQCALLAIDYLDLDDIVAEDGFWAELEIANRLDHPGRRVFLATVLDYFRLEYAIHSENYLIPNRAQGVREALSRTTEGAMDARRRRRTGGTVRNPPRCPSSKGSPLQQEHGTGEFAREVRQTRRDTG